MKKKLLSFMVIMVLVVSFCATGFASSGDGGTAEIVPQETNNIFFLYRPNKLNICVSCNKCTL